MKIMLLYANKNKTFPAAKKLQNEFKCSHVGDLNGGSQNDVEKNSNWSGIDANLLHNFAFGFCRMYKDFTNEIWNFDTSKKYFDGTCNAYLLSDDVNRKYIDWWSLKEDFQIRTIEVSELELSLVLELKYASSEIDGAHQYTSARHCRDRTLEYHIDHLQKSDISYLKSLNTQEDKIKIRFNKISQRLKNRAKRILTKKKL